MQSFRINLIEFVSMEDAAWLHHPTTHWSTIYVSHWTCVHSPKQVVSAYANPLIHHDTSIQGSKFRRKLGICMNLLRNGSYHVLSTLGYVGDLTVSCSSPAMLSQAWATGPPPATPSLCGDTLGDRLVWYALLPACLFEGTEPTQLQHVITHHQN